MSYSQHFEQVNQTEFLPNVIFFLSSRHSIGYTIVTLKVKKKGKHNVL